MVSLSLCLPSSIYLQAKDLKFESVRKAISRLDLTTTSPLIKSSLLLKACIRSGNLELGKLLHHKLIDSGLPLDSVLLNSLITLYSKCGDWENALSIFRNMGHHKRDLVSWSAIISCFANNSMESRALLTFLHMLQCSRNIIYPNEYCFTALLRSCSNPLFFTTGLAIFAFLLKTGYFDSHVCVGCALIDMFTKGGLDIQSARMVFDKMQHKNLVTWTLMITRYSQLGLLDDAVDLFCRLDWLQMWSLSLCLPSSIYLQAKDLKFESLRKAISRLDLTTTSPLIKSSLLLKACIRSGNLELGKLLHHKLIDSGLPLDSVLLNSLITLYSKCGDWENALSIFRNMGHHKRDLVSWSAIISCFANNSMESRALLTFLHMLQCSRNIIYPNEYCFTALLRSCSNPLFFTTGLAIFAFLLKTGYFDSHVCVGCALIDMFTKGGLDIQSARMVFDKMQHKNLVTWTLMITRYSQLGLLDDAVDLFCRMIVSEYTPDVFTLTSL
ncbi:Pentatricopeptide repeat-containing protein, chloroplastic [Glycine soja]|uniref:Pentatricopeptide repeat-containing protein, chloroplastic n=1 Tax=Glycine soja TaxID=3848 RepID=A0A0B2PF39_GLYSO|nr:Pentatricopeptide repeat-containing protein, chloroplastic [Glycine soja]